MSGKASRRLAVERKSSDLVYAGASFTSAITICPQIQAKKRAHPAIPATTPRHTPPHNKMPPGFSGPRSTVFVSLSSSLPAFESFCIR